MSTPPVTYFIHGTGKAFGVTDFINPNELSEPVQQVFYSTQLGICSSLSIWDYAVLLTAYMNKMLSYHSDSRQGTVFKAKVFKCTI